MITVRDLADRMRRSPIEIIKTLMNYGTMVPITASIDFDTAALIGEELGVAVKPEKQPEPEVVAVARGAYGAHHGVGLHLDSAQRLVAGPGDDLLGSRKVQELDARGPTCSRVTLPSA